ncbi:nuclease-related domain-containing protein [Neobacillus novalis]|uniref:Nuclease-related domain-containing protein n=1 Tax=Neobacillus novalis TaxID=220687 RepID=A0AA95MJZ6_9BACI|nr:nuclease-related domain-containing protein [Neobacillus novalis]WHY85297.1 nuclease-related domain-containing protein [Neobacillus novalis]
MSYKSRSKPVEAIILGILIARMSLDEKYKQRFHYLEKGYEGEIMFDSLTEKLQCQNYMLNDLLLESNGSKFQIDSLMLTQEPLYYFEVKNYECDYYFENNRFYTFSKKRKGN